MIDKQPVYSRPSPLEKRGKERIPGNPPGMEHD